MYYYGARYGVYAERSRSNPKISIFVSVDLLAEQTFEPYSYTGNNPIMFTDPTGMNADPVFDENGNHLGNTKEGFTGDILIYRGLEDSSFFENMTAKEFLNNDITKGDVFKLDELKGTGVVSQSGYENIWNHTAYQLDGQEFFGKTFQMKNIKGGIKYKNGDYNWQARYSLMGITGEIFGSGQYKYESTVANIQSSIVIHEYISHIQYKYVTKTHHMSYLLTMSTGALWNATIAKYKEFVWQNYNIYKNRELYNRSINPDKIIKYSQLIFKNFW